MKTQIGRINIYRPPPTQNNIDKFKGDINNLNKQLVEFENIFGNIYDKPLLAYSTELKQLDINILSQKIEIYKKDSTKEKELQSLQKKMKDIYT